MSFRSWRARRTAALFGLAIVGTAAAHDFTITDVLVVLREDGRFQIDIALLSLVRAPLMRPSMRYFIAL